MIFETKSLAVNALPVLGRTGVDAGDLGVADHTGLVLLRRCDALIVSLAEVFQLGRDSNPDAASFRCSWSFLRELLLDLLPLWRRASHRESDNLLLLLMHLLRLLRCVVLTRVPAVEGASAERVLLFRGGIEVLSSLLAGSGSHHGDFLLLSVRKSITLQLIRARLRHIRGDVLRLWLMLQVLGATIFFALVVGRAGKIEAHF